MQKPGFDARSAATTVLTRVIDDCRNLDALMDAEHGIETFLALEPRDRSLARAIATTALRHHNAINVVLRQLMNRPLPRNARFLIHSLHVAAAQILFMDVPDSAAVNLAVGAIGKDKRTTRFSKLANAVLRRMSREKDQLVASVANVSPLPVWIEKRLRTGFGREKTAKIAEAFRSPALLDISTQDDPAHWSANLEGIVLPWGSIRSRANGSIPTLKGYEDGVWWVQDAAAALPANLMAVKPGSQVLELCAAPGGKTAQLVSFGHEVTALDISKPRLERLQSNLDRLGMSAKLVQADILEWQPPQLYDAVLLDAPCSSTGTARRHPDVLWARRDEEISELADLQLALLKKAIQFTKPGGTLVFSNCSVLKEEGEDLLRRAMELDGIEIDPIGPEEIPGTSAMINSQGAMRVFPFHDPAPENEGYSGMDGFFACRFKRFSD